MLITHVGHSEFLITLENGFRIVTDPFDSECGYPIRDITADAVLVSHHHHDHDAVNLVKGHPQIIDCTGKHTLAQDIKVTAIRAPHDDENGKKRGFTLLFLLEAENIRLVHLGDIGCNLSSEYIMSLAPADILMVPVGGFYTIDAAQAKIASEALKARLIIPMHYRTKYNHDWPIATVDRFISLYPGIDIENKAQALRITSCDIDLQPKIAVL